MKHARCKPLLERLEDRLVPAGNVTAKVVDGSLLVTGDSRDNLVVVTQAAPGQFTLAGQDGTTVNGNSGPVTLRGATRDVKIALAAGNDVVRLGAADGDRLTVGRELRVDGGAGNNAIEASAALKIGRDFRVTGAAGIDRVDLRGGLTVGGDLDLQLGDGGNSTLITAASPFTAANTVRGDLTVVNGRGVHTTTVEDTGVGDDVTFEARGGGQDYSYVTFRASESPRRLWVGGDVTFRTRGGSGDSHTLSGINVRGDVVFSAEQGGTYSATVSHATVLDNFALRSTGRAAVTIWEASINNRLSITTGGADDKVGLENADVRHATAVATGGGPDEVLIDDTLFYGPFTLATGSGNDVVRVEAGTTTAEGDPAEFRGTAGVDLGSGSDTLQLGAAGDPTRRVLLRAAARFDGGPGADVVDPANVGSPSRRVTYVNFERVVPPPPLMPAGRYEVGEYVLDLAAADLDADGDLDLVVANETTDGDPLLTVFLNKGDGTFRNAGSYDPGAGPFSIAVADLNGDNVPDVAVANTTQSANGTVSILLGNGDGTLQPRAAIPVGSEASPADPVSIAVGDLDRDGKADLVTVNRAINPASPLQRLTTSVTVLSGNGDGSFGTPTHYFLDPDDSLDFGYGRDVAVGDLNGDGNLDVVASSTGGLGVLLGNSDGTLTVHSTELRTVDQITLADLNRDGKLDLLTTGQGLRLELGNGDGTFAVPVTLLDEALSDLAVGDFNRDGLPDIALAHFGQPEDGGKVLPGNGDGTFRAPVAFPPGPGDGPVAAADLNGDGWLDLAVGNDSFNSVTVLLNRKDWSGKSPVVSRRAPAPSPAPARRAVPAPTATVSQVRLEARLAAADAVAGGRRATAPSGTARFERRPDRVRFSAEVEDVSGPTTVVVKVNGRALGRARVVNGVADLNLDSRGGDAVPVLKAGDVVTVHHGSTGAVLVRGTLRTKN